MSKELEQRIEDMKKIVSECAEHLRLKESKLDLQIAKGSVLEEKSKLKLYLVEWTDHLHEKLRCGCIVSCKPGYCNGKRSSGTILQTVVAESKEEAREYLIACGELPERIYKNPDKIRIEEYAVEKGRRIGTINYDSRKAESRWINFDKLKKRNDDNDPIGEEGTLGEVPGFWGGG